MSSEPRSPASAAEGQAAPEGAGQPVPSPGRWVRVAPGVPQAALDDAVRAHERTIGGEGCGRLLKSDHRARVTAVDVPELGAVCVKEFVRSRWSERLQDALRGSRAGMAWRGAALCAAHGVPAPRALGVLERGGRSFFVSELVPDAVPLQEYASDRARPRDPVARRRWRTFLSVLARFVRHLHAQPLHHRDLAPKNVLVRETGDGWQLYVIDLSDVRPGPPSRRMRIRNLAQLDHLHVRPSRTDRLRFFREYAGGTPLQRDRAFLRAVDARSRARRARWLARGGEAILAARAARPARGPRS